MIKEYFLPQLIQSAETMKATTGMWNRFNKDGDEVGKKVRIVWPRSKEIYTT